MRQTPKLQDRSLPPLSIPVPPIALALALAIMGWMLLAPRGAFAQASAGITGTITDTSGAAFCQESTQFLLTRPDSRRLCRKM